MTNLSRRQFGAFLLSGTALVGLTACATGTVATVALDVLAGYASLLPADVAADITAVKTLLPIVMASVSLATVAAARTGMTTAEARARLARHKPVYRR